MRYVMVTEAFGPRRPTAYYRTVVQMNPWIASTTPVFTPHLSPGSSGPDFAALKLEIRAWLVQTIGKPDRVGHHWTEPGGEFILEDPSDALQFRLRWC